MDIKYKSEVIGSVYMNIELDLSKEKKSYKKFLKDMIEEKVPFELGKYKFYIKNYRDAYIVEKKVYIQGADLEFVV